MIPNGYLPFETVQKLFSKATGASSDDGDSFFIWAVPLDKSFNPFSFSGLPIMKVWTFFQMGVVILHLPLPFITVTSINKKRRNGSTTGCILCRQIQRYGMQATAYHHSLAFIITVSLAFTIKLAFLFYWIGGKWHASCCRAAFHSCKEDFLLLSNQKNLISHSEQPAAENIMALALYGTLWKFFRQIQ